MDANRRVLVVNADDFGMSLGVNRGIVEAHERGIVTSTSLLVRRDATGDAAAWARTRETMSVGLHLELGEWEYEDGRWAPTREFVSLADREALEREVAEQIERFSELVGRDPTHLDSHQHVHGQEPVTEIVREAARRLAIPLRRLATRYCGDFYGQTGEGQPLPEAITAEALIAILRALPAGETELACHPGYAHGLESSYRHERERELEALCDPRVQEVIATEEIKLASFREVVAVGRIDSA
jgi:chitin disaccharide deacetylase